MSEECKLAEGSCGWNAPKHRTSARAGRQTVNITLHAFVLIMLHVYMPNSVKFVTEAQVLLNHAPVLTFGRARLSAAGHPPFLTHLHQGHTDHSLASRLWPGHCSPQFFVSFLGFLLYPLSQCHTLYSHLSVRTTSTNYLYAISDKVLLDFHSPLSKEALFNLPKSYFLMLLQILP